MSVESTTEKGRIQVKKEGKLPVRFLAHPGPPAFKPAKNIQRAVLREALRFCVSVWKAGLRRTAADVQRGLHVRDGWCWWR